MTEFNIKERAAIYLEENNISGDAMVYCDTSEDKSDAMYIHDIMASFARKEKEILLGKIETVIDWVDNCVVDAIPYQLGDGGKIGSERDMILFLRGTGEMTIPPKQRRINSCYKKSLQAKNLQVKGLTVREIQKAMKASSTSLVQHYLRYQHTI